MRESSWLRTQTKSRLREVLATRTSDRDFSHEVRKHTNSAKHNTGECISDDELKNARDEQQQTTKEDDRSTV